MWPQRPSASFRTWRVVTAHVQLFHPFPVAVVVLTSALLVWISSGMKAEPTFLARATCVVLLSQIAVGATNDYVDRQRDAAAQPWKPIPSQRVAPRTALAIATLSGVLMLPAAASFGFRAFVLSILGTGAGLVYDWWLKPTPFSFTMYVAGFLVLLAWILHITGQGGPRFLLVYPGGALLLTAAHLGQSLADIESDRRTGQHGLAALLGPGGAFSAMCTLYVIVAIGGFVIAWMWHAYLAFLGIGTSLLLLALAVALWKDGRSSIEPRRRVFLVVGPGIGLLGTTCFAVIMFAHH